MIARWALVPLEPLYQPVFTCYLTTDTGALWSSVRERGTFGDVWRYF
jgi:hypothetical protein